MNHIAKTVLYFKNSKFRTFMHTDITRRWLSEYWCKELEYKGDHKLRSVSPIRIKFTQIYYYMQHLGSVSIFQQMAMILKPHF